MRRPGQRGLLALIIVCSNRRRELARQINFSYIRARDQMPKHLVPIVAAVFVMLFLWLSTVPLLSWYEFSAHHQALQDATFQWNRQALRNYSFEVEISANRRPSRLDPIRIHVREARFLEAFRVDDDEVIDIADLARVPKTIEASYELVSRLLEERLYEFAVEYDATWAYPKRIQLVESKDGRDWVRYSIRRFKPDTPR